MKTIIVTPAHTFYYKQSINEIGPEFFLSFGRDRMMIPAENIKLVREYRVCKTRELAKAQKEASDKFENLEVDMATLSHIILKTDDPYGFGPKLLVRETLEQLQVLFDPEPMVVHAK